jgi:protein TonB
MKGPGKTLAIASLALGVMSLPTAGCLGVGALVAIALGVSSLVRSRREPAADNGRELAIAGIVAAVLSLAAAVPLGILAYVWHQSPDLFADVRILSEWPKPKAGVTDPVAPGWEPPPPPPPPPVPGGRAASSQQYAPPPPPPPPPQPRARASSGAASRKERPAPEQPAAAAAPQPRANTPLRVGGEIREPKKLKHVAPAYPDIARQARAQGIVILECTIGADGTVQEVKVLRGVPLLDQSAIAAVKQWVYTPTLLNGVPVPVVMTVTVNFRLN